MLKNVSATYLMLPDGDVIIKLYENLDNSLISKGILYPSGIYLALHIEKFVGDKHGKES
jgi:hypothetical protein